jgi:hypothetical protein
MKLSAKHFGCCVVLVFTVVDILKRFTADKKFDNYSYVDASYLSKICPKLEFRLQPI